MLNSIKTGDIIRLLDGETCLVIGMPTTYLSNGSYEVIELIVSEDGKYQNKKIQKIQKGILTLIDKKRWVKPNEIAYDTNQTNNNENLDYYVEIIHDGQEIQIIPKDLKGVQLVTDESGFKTIKLIYGGETQNVVNILIGENEITNINNNENNN